MIIAILANARDPKKRKLLPTAALFIHQHTKNVLRISRSPFSMRMQSDYEKGFTYTVPDLMQGKVDKVCSPKDPAFTEFASEFYGLAGFDVRMTMLSRPIGMEAFITEDLRILEPSDITTSDAYFEKMNLME